MPTQSKILLENLSDERNAVYIYKRLASIEKNPQISEIYLRMSDVESRHADAWQKRLEETGATVPDFQPSWRSRLLMALAQRFGPELVIPSIVSMEREVNLNLAKKNPKQDPAVSQMSSEENSHARLLTQIARSAPRGMEGGIVARLEGRHRSAGGNALRAAVLGANDGLVSNLSLVMGVAGAELSNQSILITGLAGCWPVPARWL